MCGWGYGLYHHDRGQYARAGPSCVQNDVTVEGYSTGYSPAKRIASVTAARHCPDIRGYERVRARHVGCRKASAVLRKNRRYGDGPHGGFVCHTVGHGQGGGFPAKTTCRRGRAVASGWPIDAPA
ncbi:MAG: hypothetical protein QOG63_2508 [Thermoleophilaceae bacterium]|jgi:hypothetical protein|nr:hypothetical protein [Thermoleophilaceae bacterium]